jgi:hypothetical protein
VLGDAAVAGDAITIWCNNRACGNWREHGRHYRTVLLPADLATYAEHVAWPRPSSISALG